MKTIREKIAVMTLIVAALSATAPQTLMARDGHLFVIGGGYEPDDLMHAFVQKAGGTAGLILIIPSASGNPGTGGNYLDYFQNELGCTNARILDIRSFQEANSQQNAGLIEQADGIFITGGDQRRLIEYFQNSACLAALRQGFKSGMAVAGTSAGAAVLGAVTITGDGDFTWINDETTETAPAFELFEGAVFDQHFIERMRQNRLLSVVLARKELLGIGIDTSTGIWIRPNRAIKVFGSGSVVIYDARQARIVATAHSKGGNNLGVHGMTVHILLPGDLYRLKNGKIRPGKGNIPQQTSR